MFVAIFIVSGLLSAVSVTGEFSLGRPVLSGPSEAVVKSFENFICEMPDHPPNTSIHMRLFREGDRTKLLGEGTSLRGEAAVIPKVIRLSHQGFLECVAAVYNNSAVEATVSQRHYLRVIEPVKGAQIAPSGPADLFEGGHLQLRCKLRTGNHVSYVWMRNGQVVSPSPLHLLAGSSLEITRVRPGDSGSYTCAASNTFNHTLLSNDTSPELVLTVREPVSDPDISYVVLKEDHRSYFCAVTCRSSRGTPPVTFSLFNGTELFGNVTVQDRSATFKVPAGLDQRLGSFRCRAFNGDRAVISEALTLEVVPVRGPVAMHYDYDTADNFEVIGLRLHCEPARGSHPRFRWFLDKTPLSGRGSFYWAPPMQSVLLVAVGRASAGTYRCQVFDSFDNASTITSRGRYLDREVLNHIPDLVAAVVFGCFSVIVLLVSGCCAVGVMFRQKRHHKSSPLNLELKRAPYCEDDMDSSVYCDDSEVVTAGEQEFEHKSEESEDECAQYEGGKLKEL